MTAEPGPSFRWGLVLRRSEYNRRLAVNGEVERYEESTTRQELDLLQHIQANNMGIIAATYTDIASAFKRDAKRPSFEAALDDLKAGRIDGIAVWKLDRLASIFHGGLLGCVTAAGWCGLGELGESAVTGAPTGPPGLA
ncbi:MAG: recombinase family protein [Actinomycetes bacterium]